MRHITLKCSLGAACLAASLAACLAAGCATAAKSRGVSPEATATRLPDTAAERVAAQRGSDPKIDRDAEERRWGAEQAVARKREQEAKRRAAQETGARGTDVRKTQK